MKSRAVVLLNPDWKASRVSSLGSCRRKEVSPLPFQRTSDVREIKMHQEGSEVESRGTVDAMSMCSVGLATAFTLARKSYQCRLRSSSCPMEMYLVRDGHGISDTDCELPSIPRNDGQEHLTKHARSARFDVNGASVTDVRTSTVAKTRQLVNRSNSDSDTSKPRKFIKTTSRLHLDKKNISPRRRPTNFLERTPYIALRSGALHSKKHKSQ
ncbi:hypothetical protein F5I97DRAFT_1045533 [Phlebopus sp. FC_14]|nr:hypothetical protein F5I97DRAFT_1045533 [Phlebopus sp. FC_14]